MTSYSSATAEKLEKEKEVLTKAYQDLRNAHHELVLELVKLQDVELVGYEALYSEEVVESYLEPFTNMYIDATEEA